MPHVLDNPAWNALISGNANLSNGNSEAKYFSKEVSPFVGIKEISADNFAALHGVVPYNDTLGFVSASEVTFPKQWNVIQQMKALQMVYEGSGATAAADTELVPL